MLTKVTDSIRAKANYRKQKAERRCTLCWGALAADDNISCRTCLDRKNGVRQELRKTRRQKGLCNDCNEPAVIGAVCERHYLRHRTTLRRRMAKRKADGVCSICGKAGACPTSQDCPTCILKGCSRSLWNDSSRWVDLRDLLDRQGGNCAYSGLTIAVGYNASLDHRIPKALGGSNELNNLQWVEEQVNKMKWDYPEGEFLAMVKLIAARSA